MTPAQRSLADALGRPAFNDLPTDPAVLEIAGRLADLLAQRARAGAGQRVPGEVEMAHAVLVLFGPLGVFESRASRALVRVLASTLADVTAEVYRRGYLAGLAVGRDDDDPSPLALERPEP